MKDAEFEYVTGQGRPTFPALIGAFEAESDAIARGADACLDLAYGSHSRQRLDHFPAVPGARAALVYFHAGYWQSRDKAMFRFIAEPFNHAGLDVVLVNYPLSPDRKVSEIVQAAAESIAVIVELTGGLPLILSGHSAGGQLVTELSMLESARARIVGVVGLSGVYDLRPLVGTSLNRALALDDDDARAASPILHIGTGLPPAIFAVGATETDAFVQQTRLMAELWKSHGNEVQFHCCAGDDHFTILRSFTDPAHALHRATLALADGAIKARVPLI
ncbi:MAG TPA: alpha/beta hydrolase [Rhizorhapis sp.]|nr:alpha/beta hydrolase [Rhizorhapis sp.]